ncbi:MAG: zf-HC2 domain-containing protein [Anaerolineae bacterium]
MSHLEPDEIHLYLDDQLDAHARRRIQEHLADCVECRETLGRWQALLDALAPIPAEPIPLDLTPRVLARISHPTRTPRIRSPMAGLVLACQFAFALLLAVWLAPMLPGALGALPSWTQLRGSFQAPSVNIPLLVPAWQLPVTLNLNPASGILEQAQAWSALTATLSDSAFQNLGQVAHDFQSAAWQPELGAAQWEILIALLGLAWLAGNRLLLTGETGHGGNITSNLKGRQ